MQPCPFCSSRLKSPTVYLEDINAVPHCSIRKGAVRGPQSQVAKGKVTAQSSTLGATLDLVVLAPTPPSVSTPNKTLTLLKSGGSLLFNIILFYLSLCCCLSFLSLFLAALSSLACLLMINLFITGSSVPTSAV